MAYSIIYNKLENRHKKESRKFYKEAIEFKKEWNIKFFYIDKYK